MDIWRPKAFKGFVSSLLYMSPEVMWEENPEAALRAEQLRVQEVRIGELKQEVTRLEAAVKDLQVERVNYASNTAHSKLALQAEVERLSNLLWGSRCVHCGETIGVDRKNQDVADKLLRQHIQECPEHPVFKLKQENERLLGVCRDWSRGVLTRNELAEEE